MANPTRDPGSGGGPAAGRTRSSAQVPRWVKVFAIIGAVLVALFIVMALFGPGPGGHGPGRHLSLELPAGGQPLVVTAVAGHGLGAQG